MHSPDKSQEETSTRRRSKRFWLNPWFWIAVVGIPFAALVMLVGVVVGIWLGASLEATATMSLGSTIITGVFGLFDTLIWPGTLLLVLFSLPRVFPELVRRVERIVVRNGKMVIELIFAAAEESVSEWKPDYLPEHFQPEAELDQVDLDRPPRQLILEGWKDVHDALNDLVQAMEPDARPHRTFRGLGMHIAEKRYLAPEVCQTVGRVRRLFRTARALPERSVNRTQAIEFTQYKGMILAAIEKAKGERQKASASQ